MNLFSNPDEIISFFDSYYLDEESRQYLKFHARRYFVLLQEIEKIVKYFDRAPNKCLHILDIGLSFFTELLNTYLTKNGYQYKLYGLGLKSNSIPFQSKFIYLKFDLNELYLKPESDLAIVKSLPSFDLIVCAEVLEHLYTGIEPSLEAFSSWLNLGGKLLIQTPNAVSLHHRIKMLCGRNPFSILRPNPEEPGHYREYTTNELRATIQAYNLKIIKLSVQNYFNYRGGWKSSIYQSICNLFPQSFRDGITIVAKKDLLLS